MPNFNKKEITLSDGTKAIVHNIYFPNAHAMAEFIENTNAVHPWNTKIPLISHIESERRTELTKTENFEEAMELLKYGLKQDTKELLNLSAHFQNLMPYISKNQVINYAHHGSRPNVPRYLTGHSDCMYALNNDQSNKVINIYYNCSVLYTVKENVIKEKGVLTLALIDLLERLDYRVNLVFFDLNHQYEEYINIELNIKNGLQKLEPSICYFPICHPAFSRRITTAVMEKCNIEKDADSWISTYGSPVTDFNVVKSILGMKDNDIFIGPEIGDNFGNTENSIENIKIFMKYINIDKYLPKGQEFVYDEKANKFIIQTKKVEPLIQNNEQEKPIVKRKVFGFRNNH